MKKVLLLLLLAISIPVACVVAATYKTWSYHAGDTSGNLQNAVDEVSGHRVQAETGIINDEVLVPAKAYVTMLATGAVDVVLGNSSSGGGTYTFVNLDTDVITFTDTGNMILTGDFAMGQYDTLVLWNWETNVYMEVSRANN